MAEARKCPTCGRMVQAGSFCEYCGKSLTICRRCRAPILTDSVYCPRCGVLISQERKRRFSQQKISLGWWLLPVFAPLLIVSPLVGGIMAWAFNRERNPRTAKQIFLFGVALTAAWAIALYVLFDITPLG